MGHALRLTAGFVMGALFAVAGPTSAKEATRGRELVARIVAVDFQAKSIRIEDGRGPSQTLSVVGKPADRLDQLAIGRMFSLTVQDVESGARPQVIAIKRARNAPKP